MSDEEPQQTEWESEVGLSEETTYVAIYPSRKHAEEWMEEAEEQGYGSRSKYLYELIQEARAARQEGFLAYSQNESKVEELQLQVEQLQDDLEDARNSEPGEIDIEHEEFVTAFFTDRYQEFESILREVTGSGVLTGIVKDTIKEQLFDLAEEGKVEYKQGYGWRLAHDVISGASSAELLVQIDRRVCFRTRTVRLEAPLRGVFNRLYYRPIPATEER